MRRAAPAVDVLALILFVVIGRASHHHGETVAGFVSTVWPFAAGLVVGWFAAAFRRWPAVVVGSVVCALTVAVGMILRVVAGQGTALAFIVVSVVFLGIFMIGGRVALSAASRRRSPAPSR